MDIRGERIPGCRNSRYRVPETEACLECWRNNTEVCVATVETAVGKGEGEEDGEAIFWGGW